MSSLILLPGGIHSDYNISSTIHTIIHILEPISIFTKLRSSFQPSINDSLRSHVCWHVYGLLHRADRNYGEAIKAYKQALRIDSENLQILRDLSLLQIQMRDWEGYVVTRNSILTLKPTAQANWLSFALAKHRSGNYAGALHVIDIYLGTLTDDSPERKRGYTSSELQLYKNRLLLQSSQPQEALQHLQQCQTTVVDQDAWLWHTVICHFALQQYDDARQALYQLMKRGSTEDYRVHMAYQCAVLQVPWSPTNESFSKGMDTLANTQILTASQKELLLHLYQQELLAAFPRSSAIRRIPLTLLEGDDLRNCLMTYMRQSLIRGVPSLANDLGSLLVVPLEQDHDHENVLDAATTSRRYRRLSDPVEYAAHPTYQMISQIAHEYSHNLQTYSKFHPDDEEGPTNSAFLWVLMFQAGWSAMAGSFSDALSFVERVLAIVDGDSKLDAYELHASIIQRSTDDWAIAAKILDDARAMDPNDRYLNTQTTRAYLRANQWQIAIDRAGLFTHTSGNSNNNSNGGGDATTKKKTTVEMLREMQASWFELELADCRVRLGHYGAALQTYGRWIRIC
jgi:N-alpha-acetyltransferase 15/16, NatA auxiliary subunit